MLLTDGTKGNIFRGKFQGGVVRLEEDVSLPEGTAVTVMLWPTDMTDQMREEFAGWDRSSAQAWKLIEQWEEEAGDNPETLA